MKTSINLLLFLVVIIISPHVIFSQEISRSVISFGGSEYTSSEGFTLDATMGEMVIENFRGPYTLTQGFQQGEILDVAFPETPEIEAAIFPNPFEDELQVKIRLDADIEMRIYTVLGQLIYATMPQSEEITIQTSDWHTGVYFINFSAGGKRLFSEKVVKHTSK